MILLISFSFLAGLATILAPCIWPVLPIILSSSFGKRSHAHSLGITLGVILSFSFFILFVSYLVKIFHFDPNILRLASVVVIGFIGLSMLITALSRILELLIGRLGGLWNRKNTGERFSEGFITGLSLGIIWSPCAGPILAAIAALSAMGHVTAQVIIITFAYAIGAGVPLFIFAYGSQTFLSKIKILSKFTRVIQKIFGVVMILTALAIYNNWDKTLSASLLNAFPQFSTASNIFENNSTVTNELSKLTGLDNIGSQGVAPDFIGITNWLNTDRPIKITDLKGKVILVDFWTYTCINCIRTLPFVTSWYDKYKDQGFVVIGVHTPEFEFEKDTKNVTAAIEQYHIHYPVAQDNNYATWNNYSNQYWPAEYLIDVKGNIRETHFGEGNYDETEKNIQALLKEAGQQVSSGLVNLKDQTPMSQQSPETYLGSAKAEFYYPAHTLSNSNQQFNLSSNLPQDAFDLGGSWTITNDQIISGNNAVLRYNFIAGKVFLVLGPTGKSIGKIKVSLDGKIVDSSNTGSDVIDGIVKVDSYKLYNLIDLKGSSGNHLLKLEFQNSGTAAYAFTFG